MTGLTPEQKLRERIVDMLVRVYRPQGDTNLITGPAGLLYDWIIADRAPVLAIENISKALELLLKRVTDVDDVHRIIDERVRSYARRSRPEDAGA